MRSGVVRTQALSQLAARLMSLTCVRLSLPHSRMTIVLRRLAKYRRHRGASLIRGSETPLPTDFMSPGFQWSCPAFIPAAAGHLAGGRKIYRTFVLDGLWREPMLKAPRNTPQRFSGWDR
jgi:hypothetical protein